MKPRSSSFPNFIRERTAAKLRFAERQWDIDAL
jgi:hypothetical protein